MFSFRSIIKNNTRSNKEFILGTEYMVPLALNIETFVLTIEKEHRLQKTRNETVTAAFSEGRVLFFWLVWSESAMSYRTI